MAALRVTCGQAYLWEANLPSMENNTRADVAVGLRSGLPEGHAEPGTHSVFSSWWEAHAMLLISLLTKPWLSQMPLVLL